MRKLTKKSKIFTTVIVIILVVAICVGIYFYIKNNGLPVRGSNYQPGTAVTGSGLITKSDTFPTSENLVRLNESLALMGNDKKLGVHFVDVGQGDAIIVCLPDGRNMIIDGGDYDSEVADALIGYINELNIQVFDYMILTHSDADHVGSLDKVIESFQIKNIFMPKLTASYGLDGAASVKGAISTKQYYEFYTLANSEVYSENGEEKNAEIIYNTNYIEITGEGYRFSMYCQSEEYYNAISNNSDAETKNGESPICILSTKNNDIVLTGDATAETEERFINGILSPYDCDLLKVGHHGSRTSTSLEFLEYITVESAVISCGTGNSYGHPHEEILTALSNANINVYRTDLQGDIIYTVTDTGGSFKTEKTAGINYENTVIEKLDKLDFYLSFWNIVSKLTGFNFASL